jgi:hypothetical protein
MKLANLFYAISTLEEVVKYREGTLLFSTGDNRLALYDTLDTTLKVLPDKDASVHKAALVLKFEQPEQEKPNQISVRYLSQIGYRLYPAASILQQSLAPELRRVSIVRLADIKSDITTKLTFLEELKAYTKRVSRYAESQTEFVDTDGVPDEEFVQLASTLYQHHLGRRCEDMEAKYGFTADDEDMVALARKEFQKLGLALRTSLQSPDGKIRLPHSPESTPGLTALLGRLLPMTEAMAQGHFGMVADGAPIGNLEDYAATIGKLAGIDPEDVRDIIREGRQLE